MFHPKPLVANHLFPFHINNGLVKIENGMGSFKEFQTNNARCCKQRQVFGDDDYCVRESDTAELALLCEDELPYHLTTRSGGLPQFHVVVVGKKPLDFFGLMDEKQQFRIAEIDHEIAAERSWLYPVVKHHACLYGEHPLVCICVHVALRIVCLDGLERCPAQHLKALVAKIEADDATAIVEIVVQIHHRNGHFV